MIDTAANRHVGIDVGGTNIKWAITEAGTHLRSGVVETPREGGEQLVELLGELARGLEPDSSTVGIAVPGLVEIDTGNTIFIPNIPGDWRGYPLAATVARLSGKKTSVLNDARAFGQAELELGTARGMDNVLFVTLGTGVGGALARDGSILRGKIDSVGEIGHVPVDPDGDLCGCGGRGCLETVSSGSAVVAHLMRPALMSLSAVLDGYLQGDIRRLTPELISRAARDGDPWSLAAFARAGRYLGIAASSACVILQLSTVVVGGGMAGAFEFIAPEMEATLRLRRSVLGEVAVRKAELGSSAGAIGAALFARSAQPAPGPIITTREDAK